MGFKLGIGWWLELSLWMTTSKYLWGGDGSKPQGNYSRIIVMVIKEKFTEASWWGALNISLKRGGERGVEYPSDGY